VNHFTVECVLPLYPDVAEPQSDAATHHPYLEGSGGGGLQAKSSVTKNFKNG